MTTENTTNNTNVTNTNNSQSKAAKPEVATKPQAAATKPAVAPVVKESLWKRLRPTGVEVMIIAIIVAIILLAINDWNIASHLNDTIKAVNEIQAELAKPWYQFW